MLWLCSQSSVFVIHSYLPMVHGLQVRDFSSFLCPCNQDPAEAAVRRYSSK